MRMLRAALRLLLLLLAATTAAVHAVDIDNHGMTHLRQAFGEQGVRRMAALQQQPSSSLQSQQQQPQQKPQRRLLYEPPSNQWHHRNLLINGPRVQGFYLWDPQTDEELLEIGFNEQICLRTDLDGNFEARLDKEEDTTDVLMELFLNGFTNPLSGDSLYLDRREVEVPFMMFGDDEQGDIWPPGPNKTLVAGSYLLFATPHEENLKERLTPVKGFTRGMFFTVFVGPSVKGFHVWDTVTDLPAGPLFNGATLCLPTGTEANIEAVSCGDDAAMDMYLELYQFNNTLDDWQLFRKRREDEAPYLIFGDTLHTAGDVFAPESKPLVPGIYRLDATPYEQGLKDVKPDFTPVAGDKVEVQFRVRNNC